MGAVSERGSPRVSIDPRFRGHPLDRVTLFDVDAVEQGPPWELPDKKAQKFGARIALHAVPEELQPRSGLELVRSGGAIALVGDLTRPPFEKGAQKKLLENGPLTFEAEHLGSNRDDTRIDDDQASGGQARSGDPAHRIWLPKHNVSTGRTRPLPPGKYVAVHWVRWECRGYERERVGFVRVKKGGRHLGRRRLDCETMGPAPEYRPMPIEFELNSRARIRLEVTYQVSALWHDRTEIWRREVWNARDGK
jgi:hypothetical protein